MDDSTPSGNARPELLLLDVPPATGGAVITRDFRRLAERLTTRSGGVLWVEGPDGAGKTTALAAVVPLVRGLRAVQRIECHPGLRIEEALYRISDFLRHIGIHDLSRTLDQRTSLASKLEVLLQTVHREALLLWWDDVHRCPPSGEEQAGDIWTALIARDARLGREGAGGMIFTADRPPPETARLERFCFQPLEDSDARALWESCGEALQTSPPAVAFEEIPAAARRTPLQIRLLAGILLKRGPEALREELRAADDDSDGEWPLDRAIRLLHAPSRRILECLAVFRRPLSRKAYSFIRQRSGDPAPSHPIEQEGALLELRDLGLVQLAGEPDDGPHFCRLHPAIQARAERLAREDDPSRWKELLAQAGRYFLQLAARGGDVWHFHTACDFLHQGGRYEEAYQVHKVFIEELLKWGYLDLARHILRRAVDTTSGLARAIALGNLAIVYKNEADFDRALALYTEARTELSMLGDSSNLARVLHQIGNTLYLRGDLEQALQHYEESREISRKIGQAAVASATQVQIANVLCALGERERAFQSYEDSIRDIEESRNRSMIAAVRLQMGHLHFLARRYIEAESDFAEAERQAILGGDGRSQLKAIRSRGLVLRELKDFDRAEKLLLESEELAIRLGDLVEKANCRLLRGELEESRGQFARALEHYEESRRRLRELSLEGLVSRRVLDALEKSVSERTEQLAGRIGAEAYERLLGTARRK
ncbi:MAG: tetratricopeptide repeat protein [Planctomycetes bacterium]|nr:tetratricopeptide repeat protein [Planctomycetota bacterium]